VLLWASFASPARATVVVYDDAAASGWTTGNSWWTDIYPSAVVPSPYQGSYSLQSIYTQAWGAVRFTHNSGVSTSGYNTLTLAFRKYDSGTTPLDKALYVVLYDAADNQLGSQEVKPYVPGGTPVAANTWHYITIPLADLGAVGKTVKHIDLQSETLYTLYFDEVKFEQIAGNDPGIAYDDALKSGWYDWSWSTQINFSSSTKYNGTYGIEAVYQTAWAGMDLHRNVAFNTTGYNTLRFAVNGGSSGGQELYVGIANADNNVPLYIPLSEYVEGGVLQPNTWYQVIIPLAYLSAYSIDMKGVVIQSATLATVYFDEVVISTLGGTSKWDPPPPPPVDVSSFIYDDAVGSGWNGWAWGDTALDFSSTAEIRTDTYSVRAEFLSAWDSLEFYSADGFDTTSYGSLSFSVHGGTTGGEDIYILLLDMNGSQLGYQRFADHIGALDDNEWHDVTIPLANFNAGNAQVQSVVFQSAAPTVGMYFADVRFDPVLPNQNACIIVTGRVASTSWTGLGSPPQCVPPAVAFFGDGNGGGISRWFWGVANMEVSSPVQSGATALQVEYLQAWGGVQFYSPIGYDSNKYGAITFAVQGTQSGQELYAYFVNTDGQAILPSVEVSDYIVEDALQPDWRMVWIPISDLIGPQTVAIGSLAIESNIAGTVYLDEVKMVETMQWPLPGEFDAASISNGGNFGDHWEDRYCLDEGLTTKRLLHTGIDYPAATGTVVKATHRGKVRYAATDAIWGGYVVVESHGADFTTTYTHVVPSVAQGAEVETGDEVATIYNLPSGPHLHLQVRMSGYDSTWSLRGRLPEVECDAGEGYPERAFSESFINPALVDWQ